MAITGDVIVNLACQDAQAPGFTSQAYQLLNIILAELCQTYDFDVARGIYNFNFNTVLGSGPMPLPSDYLRCDNGDVFYTIQGVKYEMVNIDLAEFDMMVQQAGLQSYPNTFATDLSLQNSAVPVMYVWPPPSGSFAVTVRYRRQMPDYVPNSAKVVWFPNTAYLRRRLAGELMATTDDERMKMFLGDGPEGAQGILDRFLKLKDDDGGRAHTVKLDRRSFGGGGSNLRNTKTIGW